MLLHGVPLASAVGPGRTAGRTRGGSGFGLGSAPIKAGGGEGEPGCPVFGSGRSWANWHTLKGLKGLISSVSKWRRPLPDDCIPHNLERGLNLCNLSEV